MLGECKGSLVEGEVVVDGDQGGNTLDHDSSGEDACGRVVLGGNDLVHVHAGGHGNGGQGGEEVRVVTVDACLDVQGGDAVLEVELGQGAAEDGGVLEDGPSSGPGELGGHSGEDALAVALVVKGISGVGKAGVSVGLVGLNDLAEVQRGLVLQSPDGVLATGGVQDGHDGIGLGGVCCGI